MYKRVIAALLLLFFSPAVLYGQNWTGASGETGDYRTWEAGGNWSGYSVPGTTGTVTIEYSDNYIVTYGASNTSSPTIFNGTLNLNGHLYMGPTGFAQSPAFAAGVGAKANVTLSGGQLYMWSDESYFGGHPNYTSNSTTVFTLDQQAGTVAAGHLYLGAYGATGNWTMAPGTTAAPNSLRIGANGGTGTLIATSADIFTMGSLNVGEDGSGTLNLTGSQVEAGTMKVGAYSGSIAGVTAASGIATMTGGTLMLMSGTEFMVGASTGMPGAGTATGTFTLNSGTVGLTGRVHIGSGEGATGTLNINSGRFIMSHGEEYSSDGFYLGEAGGSGTVNQRSGEVFAGGQLSIGYLAGSTGEYTIDSGSLTVADSSYVGYGGTGTLNVNGGTVDLNHYSVVGLDGGTGTVNQAGGSVSIKNQLIIGSGEGSKGIYNLKAGTVQTLDGIIVGSEGSGIVNQTGGNVITNNVSIMSNGSANKSVYNFSAGTIQVATIDAIGSVINMYGGTLQASNHVWLTGTLENEAVMNLYGGTIETDMFNGAGGMDKAVLNIYGSKATISTIHFNDSSDNLDLNYWLDRGGVTTAVATDTASLYGVSEIPINMDSGFMALGVDHIDLVSGKTLMGDGGNQVNTLADIQNTNAVNNTPYTFDKAVGKDNGQTQLRYVVNDTGVETWDLIGEFRFADGLGHEKGVLKVEGNSTDLLAIFEGLEGDDGTLASKLVNYLNSTLDTGTVFYLDPNNNNIILKAGYLGDAGYAYFGWDLTGFNPEGSNVSLLGFNEIPEPATWAMMVLGALGLMLVRKRRQA